MRANLILIVSFLLSSATAQKNKTYRINSLQQDSSDLVHSIYRYPKFEEGVVAFTNQPLATANLNYNHLSGQILFMTSKGEALELAKPETLQFIAIGEDTFYYVDKGYVEIITHYPKFNLAKKQLIEFNGKEKKGAYGTYSVTAAASSVNTVTDENVTQKRPIDENTWYAASSRYYLSDKANNFNFANKKKFYKLFSRDETKLLNYLKNNPVRFSKEDDLLRLLEFLQDN